MCDEPCREAEFTTVAHPKAMRTAHDLAMKKSESASGEFEKVDIYLLYFRRIYDHELKRRLEIMYAREDLAVLLRNLDKEVCGYHQENQMWYETEEFGKKEDYLKAAEKKYRESKWPKGVSR